MTTTTKPHDCPVASGCMRGYIMSDKPHYVGLFTEDGHDEWAKVSDRVVNEAPSNATQMLRAFYAIEYTYHILIPEMMLSNASSTNRDSFMRMRSTRSVEGLKILKEELEQRKEELQSTSVMLALKDGVYNPQENAMVEDQIKTLGALLESINVLSQCLKNFSRPKLSIVGTNFGEALASCFRSQEAAVNIIHTLLSINIKNAKTPWKN